MEKDYVLNIIKVNECKICLEHVDEYKQYCKCSGSIKYIHKECLEKYINENQNKIEKHNCYKYKIKCDICNSYIYFYYNKKKLFYIYILTYFVLYIIFSILYFIFTKTDNYMFLFVLLYLFITCCYCMAILVNITKKKIYKSYIQF